MCVREGKENGICEVGAGDYDDELSRRCKSFITLKASDEV